MSTTAARRIPRWLPLAAGSVLALAAVAFVANSLRRDWDRISEAFADMALAPAAVGLVLAAAAMSLIGLLWSQVLTERGAPTRPLQALRWYYVGEIGKYLPGGVWPVLGRGELARRGGSPSGPAYASTIISLLYLYGAAIVGVAITAPWLDRLPQAARGAAMAGGVLVVIGLHPRIGTWLLSSLERLSKRTLGVHSPAWGRAVGLMASYLPVWAAIGAVSWAIAAALGFDVSPVGIIGATTAAWLTGFLAIPVPGGAGIREAVFVLLSGLPRAEAAAVAVAARVMFVAVDLAGFGLCLPSVRHLRSGPSQRPPSA